MNRQIKKVLVVKNRAMGDAIIGLGAIQYLKSILPNGEIIYATPSWITPLFENVKIAADQVIPLDLKGAASWWPMAKRLHELKIDAIFEMFQSGRGKKFFSLYSFIHRIPYYAHNHHIQIGPVQDQGKIKSNIQRDLDGAWSFFDGKGTVPDYLDFEPLIENPVRKVKKIIFGVVATRQTKMWDLQNFATIKGYINQEFSSWEIQIPLSQSDQDQKLKQSLISLGFDSSCFIESPLNTLVSHVRDASFYLGNDTGLKHLCVSLGIRTYTLFGPEPPMEWHPYDRKKHPYFFIEPLECRTKTQHYCGLSLCDDMKCLNMIRPQDVWNILKCDLENYS